MNTNQETYLLAQRQKQITEQSNSTTLESMIRFYANRFREEKRNRR